MSNQLAFLAGRPKEKSGPDQLELDHKMKAQTQPIVLVLGVIDSGNSHMVKLSTLTLTLVALWPVEQCTRLE